MPIMAGDIRQPIDVATLQKYVEKNVPEIKTPLEVKQVATNPPYPPQSRFHELSFLAPFSSASVSQTPPTSLSPPTAQNMSCVKSLQAHCSPKQPIRLSGNIASYMHWRRQTFRCPRLTVCVRTPRW
jgi:hypothetical protein